jgi:hypothetical protein
LQGSGARDHRDEQTPSQPCSWNPVDLGKKRSETIELDLYLKTPARGLDSAGDSERNVMNVKDTGNQVDQYEVNCVSSCSQKEDGPDQKHDNIRRLKTREPAQKVEAEVNSSAALQMLPGERPCQNKTADGKEYSDTIATVPQQSEKTVLIVHPRQKRRISGFVLMRSCARCHAAEELRIAVKEDNGKDRDEP